jgi:5-methylcytosine-specific restriction endonuclease McrA
VEDREIWEGFAKPDSEFFRVPNDFVEAMARIDNMSELKVILYIMRHTWGFQEYDTHKKITYDEFVNGRKHKDGSRMDSGTGLSDVSKSGVARAIEHGFIECEVDCSDRARIKKYYRLKLKPNVSTSNDHHQQSVKPKSKKDRILDLQAMPYPEYLQTPEWQSKRQKALRFAGFRCQICNSPDSLNVHHRTYERKGHERLGDLIVLCQDCHATFHANGELFKDEVER